MHEYLIVNYTNYIEPTYKTTLRIVGMKDLLDELKKATDDRLYCIAVYEIAEQCFLDFSTPRPKDPKEEVLR